MLNDYFAIQIDNEANLLALPILFDNFVPNMVHLPEFVLSLAHEVDWESEKECFHSTASVIAKFYTIDAQRVCLEHPSRDHLTGSSYEKNDLHAMPNRTSTVLCKPIIDRKDCERDSWHNANEWRMRHVVFPALQSGMQVPKRFASDGTVIHVASLEELYKVFERC